MKRPRKTGSFLLAISTAWGVFADVLLCLCIASMVAVEEPPPPRSDEQPPGAINNKVLPAFLARADKTPLELAWKAETPEEHEAWKQEFGAKMLDLLGRMPEPVPLEVKWAETKQFDNFSRHKIYLRSEENYWVPAYYFVPKRPRGKRPALVCLHGHSGIYPYIREGDARAREQSRAFSLDYAVYLAEHGYVTIAPVIRGWDETAADQDPGVENRQSCRRVTMNALLVGMTPIGLRCWDAMRCIDFLQSQGEVDAEKIGVAGLSGGGTLALYLPILDDRVKLAMIAGAFSSFRTSVYTLPHCICNCLPHVMQYGDMSDVVALVAPRPVLVINGTKDRVARIEEAKKGYAKLKEVYALSGASENLEADFFDGPHAWSNNKTLPFLEKHFGKW